MEEDILERDIINKKGVAFIIVLIAIFASYPLFGAFFLEGHDSNYHLLRIEGIATGLMSGQFPVRIHPVQFNGYGYGNSIFYGEIFLYIPAVLRLLGMSLQGSYKIFVILINLVTAVTAYKCFLRIFAKRKIALVCTVLYVLCPYRIENIYTRCAVGEYCAMIFWPVIACGLYRLFFADFENNDYKYIWVTLTLGYSGLMQSHLISCELAAFLSVAICVICIKRVLVKERIVELLKFFAATLLVNAFFLVPFLDYMLNGGVLAVDKGSQQGSAIQETGTFAAQYFNLFANGEGYIYRHGTKAYVPLGMSGEMGSTLGLSLGGAVVLFVIILVMEYNAVKKEKMFRMAVLCAGAGFALTFMATNLFPWDSFARNFGSIISNIQFPIRLLSVSTIFLTLLAGCSLLFSEKIWNKSILNVLSIGLISVTIVTSGFVMYDKLNRTYGAYVYSAENLDTSGSGSMSEYLLTEAENYDFSIEGLLVSGDIAVSDYKKEYTNVSFNVNYANEAGNVDVPLLAYKGYKAMADDGSLLDTIKNSKGILSVNIPKGFGGNVKISYAGVWYWHLAEWISAVTVVYFVWLERKRFVKDRVK